MVFAPETVMVIRLLLASLLGAIIGLERELHGRPAGFRTHLLVSLGSCLFVITSIEFYRIFGNFSGSGPVGVDPARVAAQVVAGIGFLGAGAIIREKASVRGLTTAACLWVAAAIGIACGVGLFSIASVVTVIALASLLLLKKIEEKLHKDTYVSIKIVIHDTEGILETLGNLFEVCQLQVHSIRLEKDIEAGQLSVEYDVKYTSRAVACKLVDMIGAVEGIRKISLN
jgi:putative Mg2+ transporter-C (MgtC) family protein